MSSIKISFLERLITSLQNLPGVGIKTATRYAFYIIQNWTSGEVNELVEAITEASQKISHCKVCNLLCIGETCDICNDQSRDQTKVLVVKDTKDVISIEKSGQYYGLYHILGGNISPLDGIGPDEITIDMLEKRLETGIEEIILATGFTPQGETTALYIEKIFQSKKVTISKIGYGLPAGGDIEYADELTLRKALETRTSKKE